MRYRRHQPRQKSGGDDNVWTEKASTRSDTAVGKAGSSTKPSESLQTGGDARQSKASDRREQARKYLSEVSVTSSRRSLTDERDGTGTAKQRLQRWMSSQKEKQA